MENVKIPEKNMLQWEFFLFWKKLNIIVKESEFGISSLATYL